MAARAAPRTTTRAAPRTASRAAPRTATRAAPRATSKKVTASTMGKRFVAALDTLVYAALDTIYGDEYIPPAKKADGVSVYQTYKNLTAPAESQFQGTIKRVSFSTACAHLLHALCNDFINDAASMLSGTGLAKPEELLKSEITSEEMPAMYLAFLCNQQAGSNYSEDSMLATAVLDNAIDEYVHGEIKLRAKHANTMAHIGILAPMYLLILRNLAYECASIIAFSPNPEKFEEWTLRGMLVRMGIPIERSVAYSEHVQTAVAASKKKKEDAAEGAATEDAVEGTAEDTAEDAAIEDAATEDVDVYDE